MKKLFFMMMVVALSQTSFAQAWNGSGDQKVQVGLSGWGNGTGITGTYDYHLQDPLGLPEKWDIYPGVDVGVLGNTFGLGVHLGARYFFNDKFGVFLEAGNNGSLGVSINL